MAHPLRPEVAEGLYRLTSRGDGREDICQSDNDRADWLAAITRHFGVHYTKLSRILSGYENATKT
jgi:hypothetical protein